MLIELHTTWILMVMLFNNCESTFNNFKINSRRSRASDDALNEAKAKYFEEMKQHFDNKTYYIVTQHDYYLGAVSFEYTYKLKRQPQWNLDGCGGKHCGNRRRL